MRLSEAARVLGVAPDADKQTIDQAARQQIRKWHPDRWRNASEAEQKKAAEEYSKVSKAQQTLQHPETADPEVSDIPSPSRQAGYGGGPAGGASYGGGYASGGYSSDAGSRRTQVQYDAQFRPDSRPTGTSGQWASFDDGYQGYGADSRPVKYNTATSFEDSFGAVPDTMEQTLNNMHNEEVTRLYRQTADFMKVSMSVIASVALFLSSLIQLFGMLGLDIGGIVAEGSFGGSVASVLPATSAFGSIPKFGILVIIALVKMLTYDALIAPFLARKVPFLTPSLICGIDMIIWGMVGYGLSGAMPVSRVMYGFMILIGVLMAAVAYLVRLMKEAR